MNLDQIKSFFKNSKPLLVLVPLVVVIYLVWSYYINLDNPIFGVIPKPVITNFISSKPTWDTNPLALPGLTKAGVYPVIKRGFTPEEASLLANGLGFKEQPLFIAGTLLKWTSKAAEFSLNMTTGAVSYKNTDPSVVFSGRTSIDTNFLAQRALDFINKLKLDTSTINTKSPTVNYYKAAPQSPQADPATQADANLIIITFKREIDGLPITSNSGDEVITVSVNTKGEVINFDGGNLEVEQKNATYHLKSKQEAIDAVQKGEAKVVRYSDPTSDLTLPDPTKVIVNQAQVKLFDDGAGKYIEPIYVFNGLLVKNFVSVQADVYLPAIASKYLQ